MTRFRNTAVLAVAIIVGACTPPPSPSAAPAEAPTGTSAAAASPPTPAASGGLTPSPTPTATAIPTPTPSPTPFPVLTASWVAPKAGTKLATSALKLSANASFDQPTTSIAKVTFTVSWGWKSKTACTAREAKKGVWTCSADLWKLGAPLGKLTLSFDVTDSGKEPWAAPAGTRTISMTSTTTASVRVPVVGCPTQDAARLSDAYLKPRGLPSSKSRTVPLGIADKMALYGTRASGGVERWLLGPRGWTCKAGYGVDGSGGIWLQNPKDASSRIDFGTSGANESSGWYIACAYFAAARKAAAAIGADCGTPKPPVAEIVTGRTTHVVLLADPSRVKGSLAGSGGPYRTEGGIWYGNDVYSTHLDSWAETVACALPAGSSQTCAAVVEDWKRRVGR